MFSLLVILMPKRAKPWLAAHKFINRFPKRMPEKIRASYLQECTNSRSDELVEHVPEALKNTLMVMHGSGVLVPTWKV